MNTHLFKQSFSLLGLGAVIVSFSGLTAQAQEAQSTTFHRASQPQATANTPVILADNNISNRAVDLQSQKDAPPTSTFAQTTPLPTPENSPPAPTTPRQQTTPTPTVTPTPETTPAPTVTPTPETTPAPTAPADAPAVTPGRPTRGGSSYIGVGANIGISGGTTLGDGAFSVISKIGLTNTLSLRPAVLFGDDVSFVVPVTLDFPTAPVTATEQAQVSAAPYIGAGVEISTADDSNVGFLITGGVDVPIANQVTANAALNIGFLDDTNIGLQLGVGYNF
jgi:hypothetical protein